jgi:hypothetical protein
MPAAATAASRGVPKLRVDDIKGFALKSSIALQGHHDTFVPQAHKKHRGDMPQQAPASGPLVLSDRSPEAVQERYVRLHGHNMMMDASKGRAFYRQKDAVSEFGEMFLTIPPPLRQIHQIRDRKDKSMPPGGYTYSRLGTPSNQVPEPYDCTVDAVRPRTVGWSPGNARALEPMPAEFEQLATVISMKTRPSTSSGAMGPRGSFSSATLNFTSLGPNDETGREGGLTRVMMQSKMKTLPASPTGTVGNSLMQASQSSLGADKSLRSRQESDHSRPSTTGSMRYDAIGAGKVWEASKRIDRRLRLQRREHQTRQRKIDAQLEKERRECIEDLEKFDLNMKGGRKRFEGWPTNQPVEEENDSD